MSWLRAGPTSLEVAPSRRQNLAWAPELVNNASHARTIRLAGKFGCAQRQYG
jgi:hypothetical protein